MTQARVPVDLSRSYKLLNHGPTTLVSAAHGGRTNVMAAAWVMALDFEPPKLAAVLAADTYTRELAVASGELVINLPTVAQAELTYAVGSVSGRETDKFTTYGITTTPGSVVAAPMVDGCVAWLECRLYEEPHMADAYDLFVCEVVAAWADPEVWNGRDWTWANDQKRTLHHCAGGVFFAIGERLETKK
jgi:flavin reductase (DIM6/NTAB) family NADH-FMN oxidoreductase RutF